MSVPTDGSFDSRRDVGGFSLQFPSDTTFLNPVRILVHRWLDLIQAPRDSWDLVVTELLSNAVKASPSAHSGIQVEFRCADNQIQCSVINDGIWASAIGGLQGPPAHDTMGLARYAEVSPPGSQPDEPSAEDDTVGAPDRGRGLSIVTKLTDGGSAEVVGGQTAVTVWRNL